MPLSLAQNVLFLGVLTATGRGPQQLADGNLIKGASTTALGMSAINLLAYSMDQSAADIIVHDSATMATSVITLTGLANIVGGLFNRNLKSLKDIIKGGCQVIVGETFRRVVASSSTQTLSKMNRIFAIGTSYAAISYIGIKDIQKGNYVRGILEAGVGMIGLIGFIGSALAPK